MFYKIEDDKLFDYADYKYSNECLETDIITSQELREHPNKVIVGDVEIEIEVIDYDGDGNPIGSHTEIKTVRGLILNPNYEQEEAEKERQRIDNLTLTPSDVERALYKAKEMDFEDLKALISKQAPQLDMKALAIEFRANNFYRGVVVNGIRLIDTVGALLGYTPTDMDYLFENKELPTNESDL